MWGNPISADRASSTTGRDEHDLMAIGDYSYDDKVRLPPCPKLVALTDRSRSACPKTEMCMYEW